MSGHSTCISRNRTKLPATLLSVGELNNKTSTSWREALDAAERALLASDVVLTARTIPENKPTLLDQIAAIADITISKHTPITTTLEDLGVTDDKLLSVGTYLKVVYNVAIGEMQLPQLNLETILHLEQSDFMFEDIKGLGTFYSSVDSDELTATTEMVFMPTITSGAFLRDDEFDASQSYLCIIPGMEGHHERFRELCERLKLPAFVLQPGLDHPHETVLDTARRYANYLTSKTAVKDNFYLLGYESGVLVALEMAKILEEHGLTGTVYCIGYAPDEFKAVVEENLVEYKTEEQLQAAVVRHMVKLMADEDLEGLDKALQNATTWDQKVNACVRTLRGRVSHSVQYASALIEAALSRIEQARIFNAEAHPLRSRLVLLRANTGRVPPTTTSLQQHSQQPVKVHQLRAPLGQAAEDTRCAAIINQYLDTTILTAFDKKNICEAYLLNPNSFMSIQTADDKF